MIMMMMMMIVTTSTHAHPHRQTPNAPDFSRAALPLPSKHTLCNPRDTYPESVWIVYDPNCLDLHPDGKVAGLRVDRQRLHVLSEKKGIGNTQLCRRIDGLAIDCVQNQDRQDARVGLSGNRSRRHCCGACDQLAKGRSLHPSFVSEPAVGGRQDNARLFVRVQGGASAETELEAPLGLIADGCCRLHMNLRKSARIEFQERERARKKTSMMVMMMMMMTMMTMMMTMMMTKPHTQRTLLYIP